jgi:hypothetical protein
MGKLTKKKRAELTMKMVFGTTAGIIQSAEDELRDYCADCGEKLKVQEKAENMDLCNKCRDKRDQK